MITIPYRGRNLTCEVVEIVSGYFYCRDVIFGNYFWVRWDKVVR